MGSQEDGFRGGVKRRSRQERQDRRLRLRRLQEAPLHTRRVGSQERLRERGRGGRRGFRARHHRSWCSSGSHGQRKRGVASGCPGCKLPVAKVLDSNRIAFDSDIVKGIEWSGDHGADVVTFSLSGPEKCLPSWRGPLTYLAHPSWQALPRLCKLAEVCAFRIQGLHY